MWAVPFYPADLSSAAQSALVSMMSPTPFTPAAVHKEWEKMNSNILILDLVTGFPPLKVLLQRETTS